QASRSESAGCSVRLAYSMPEHGSAGNTPLGWEPRASASILSRWRHGPTTRAGGTNSVRRRCVVREAFAWEGGVAFCVPSAGGCVGCVVRVRRRLSFVRAGCAVRAKRTLKRVEILVLRHEAGDPSAAARPVAAHSV